MSDNYIKAAFDKVVADAVEANASYVSLYVSLPFYGGPEEGGWYGSDTELVEYRRCTNDEEAQALREAVLKMSETLNEEARQRFNEEMARQLEWVEEHDPLCDDANVYFPEPDGEERYWVAVENRPGSMVSQGDRCYS